MNSKPWQAQHAEPLRMHDHVVTIPKGEHLKAQGEALGLRRSLMQIHVVEDGGRKVLSREVVELESVRALLRKLGIEIPHG